MIKRFHGSKASWILTKFKFLFPFVLNGATRAYLSLSLSLSLLVIENKRSRYVSSTD